MRIGPVPPAGPDADDAHHVPRVGLPPGADLPSLWAERGAETLEDRMAVVAELLAAPGSGDAELFPRPGLMSALERADPDHVASREDRLRAFGRLLRDGRIRRAGRGLYTAASAETA